MSKQNYYNTPAEVMDNLLLSNGAKNLYARLVRLAVTTGFCWGSNKYLAEKMGCSVRTIVYWIAELKKSGFILNEIVHKGFKKLRRIFPKIILTKRNPLRINTKRTFLRKVHPPAPIGGDAPSNEGGYLQRYRFLLQRGVSPKQADKLAKATHDRSLQQATRYIKQNYAKIKDKAAYLVALLQGPYSTKISQPRAI